MSTTASLAHVLPSEALAETPLTGAARALAEGAEAVVHPRSTEEVAEALRWATAHDVGVLPVASGERAQVGRLEGRFVVLVTDRLRGLEIYEPADVTLTAKVGTGLAEIRQELGQHRQWLPFDPPHADARTLGGLVASGDSGPVATGYGELRNHVLGATVVCGDGRVLRLGGRVVKNVAGFDLLRPVVGSRGRLGVITSVCLRAFPVPAEDRVLVCRSVELEGLSELARAVRTAPILPASSVVWAPAPSLGAEAALLVRLHGAQRTVDADQAALEEHAGVVFERSENGADVLAEARDHAFGGRVTASLSVLPSRLFEGLAYARSRLGEIEVAADAYAGSGRLSTDDVGIDALREVQDEVQRLGGALRVYSSDRKGALDEVGSRPDAAELELVTRLERLFDPSGVLWPCRA